MNNEDDVTYMCVCVCAHVHVYTHTRTILLSLKKEWNSAISNNMDGPRGQYA